MPICLVERKMDSWNGCLTKNGVLACLEAEIRLNGLGTTAFFYASNGLKCKTYSLEF